MLHIEAVYFALIIVADITIHQTISNNRITTIIMIIQANTPDHIPHIRHHSHHHLALEWPDHNL